MASKRKAAPSQRSLEAEMRRLGKQLDALMASARSAEAGVRKAWRDIEAAVRTATRRFRETA